jgi:hypothetical protein
LIQIEPGGHGLAARDDQLAAVDNQVAVRGQPAKRLGILRVRRVEMPAAVVQPNHLAGFGVE